MTEEEQIKEFEALLTAEFLKLVTESGPVINNKATRNAFTDHVQNMIDIEVAAGRMAPAIRTLATDYDRESRTVSVWVPDLQQFKNVQYVEGFAPLIKTDPITKDQT